MFREKFAAVAIATADCLEVFDFIPFSSESRRGNIHHLCEVCNSFRSEDRTGVLSLPKIFELSRYRSDPRVENIPYKSTWLSQHFGGLL